LHHQQIQEQLKSHRHAGEALALNSVELAAHFKGSGPILLQPRGRELERILSGTVNDRRSIKEASIAVDSFLGWR
jgi:hypothetical protein